MADNLLKGKIEIEVAKSIAQIKTLRKEVSKMQAKAGTGLKKVDKSTQGLSKSMGILGKALPILGIAVLTTGIVKLGTASVKTFANFDRSMSKLRAVSGLVGKNSLQYKNMEKLIKKMGATTEFTAIQSASAMQVLKQSGLSTADAMETLESTLKIAQGTGEDLTSTAETLAGVLNSFNFSGEKSSKVADVMADSFRKSNLNLERFRESMKLAGTSANLAGVKFTDATGALAIMANNMITGTRAGTGLNRVMVDLRDTNSKIVKALGGASLETHTLAELMDLAREKGIGFVKANELVGRVGAKTLNVLIKESEKLGKLSEQFDKVSGSADAMAKELEGDAQGAIIKLGSIWESFKTEIGKGLNTTPVTDGLSSVVGFFADWQKNVNDLRADWEEMIKTSDDYTESQKKQILSFKLLNRIGAEGKVEQWRANNLLKSQLSEINTLELKVVEARQKALKPITKLDMLTRSQLKSVESLLDASREEGLNTEKIKILKEAVAKIDSARAEKAKEVTKSQEKELEASTKKADADKKEKDNELQRKKAFDEQLLEAEIKTKELQLELNRSYLQSKIEQEVQAIEDGALLKQDAIDRAEAEAQLKDAEAKALSIELEKQRMSELALLQQKKAKADEDKEKKLLVAKNKIWLLEAQSYGKMLGSMQKNDVDNWKQLGANFSTYILGKIQGYLIEAIAGGVAKEVGTKGAIGIGTGAVLTATVTGIFTALKGKVGNEIQRLAGGGLVNGQGGSREDLINARLSPNEYVLDAETVRNKGLQSVKRYHRGFADGGSVSNNNQTYNINQNFPESMTANAVKSLMRDEFTYGEFREIGAVGGFN